jgi:hypothetical protein
LRPLEQLASFVLLRGSPSVNHDVCLDAAHLGVHFTTGRRALVEVARLVEMDGPALQVALQRESRGGEPDTL